MQRAVLQKKITDKAKLATIGALCVFNTYGIEMLGCLTDSGRESFYDFRYRLERSRTESESKSRRKQDGTEKVSKRFQDGTDSFSDEGFTPSPAEMLKTHRDMAPTEQVAVRVEEKEELQAMPCMLGEQDGGTRCADVAGAYHRTPMEALESSFNARGFSDWSGYCSKVRSVCPASCDGRHAQECFRLLTKAIERCDRGDPWGITRTIIEQDRGF